jgi:single-stranded-DNA-specific exonuclease
LPEEQRWILRRRSSPEFLEQWSHLDPVLARVLYARKLDTPELIAAMLEGEPPLDDPFLLADMAVAVERFRRALRQQEPVVVYGDYDVDGVCATALLITALRQLGAQVSAYIPDRFTESYGLNIPAVERLRAQGVTLLITVDCGIRSVAEIARAQEIGLDVVVTDHHSLPTVLPPALAIINPKRPESAYAYRDLAGVGVAHRLVTALCQAEVWRDAPAGEQVDPDSFLDLVALATVADVAPLTGENRTLVRRGLERLRRAPRPGVAALLAVAGTSAAEVDSQAIGFRLGPRLNAAGRLEHGSLAMDLLLAPTLEEATALAEQLDQVNQLRQDLLSEQVELARAVAEVQLAEAPMLVVDSPAFNEGIVGLIAGRLAEEFCCPALVLRRDEAMCRGSARSIEGYHITHALDACADLLARYGGHARAAGFSVAVENLEALRSRLMEHANARITAEMRLRRYDVDAIIPLSAVTEQTPGALSALEPFGADNPEPALATLGLTVRAIKAIGRDARHLRLYLGEGDRVVEGIAFRMGHLSQTLAPGSLVDVIYRPEMNQWNGNTRLQLRIGALRPATGGAA